jgi:hypothetical protein
MEARANRDRKNRGRDRSNGRQSVGVQGRYQMQMTELDYNGLLVRVSRLEKQNRLLKIMGLLMLLSVTLFLTVDVKAQRDSGVMQASDPGVRQTTTTVEARTYLLKDSAGILRGKMSVDGDRHPMLEFYDLDGNVIWSTDAHAIPTK